MRRSRTPAPRRLFLSLLLAAFLEGWGRVEALDITQNVYTMLAKNRPSPPVGGPYTMIVPKETPPREFRGTFEGIDYDNPPHQVSTNKAKREFHSCYGEYSRCILRQSGTYDVCGLDYYNNYYYKFNSICDIEYANCFNNVQWYSHVKEADFRQNRYIYDGDGFYKRGGYRGDWYCYEQDDQINNGWRRAAAALARARRFAVDGVKGLLQ